jgi:hypothetical protein
LNDPQDFNVSGNEVWHFDQNCGATYFSATGGNESSRENAKKNLAQSQRCKFWNGSGDLVGGTQGQVTVTVLTQPTEPRTCWTLTSTTSSTFSVNLTGIDISGESLITKDLDTANSGCSNRWTTKYSFSLWDGTVSRVQNVAYAFEVSTDGGSTWSSLGTYSGATTITNITNGEYDYVHKANAGIFGNPAAQPMLRSGWTMGSLCTGPSPDDFCGNDGNPNGNANWLQVAHVDGLGLINSLGLGMYRVTISGTIKGNNTVGGDVTFTATSGGVSISAEGCQ